MFPDGGPPVFIEINYNFGRKGLGGTPGFRRLFQGGGGVVAAVECCLSNLDVRCANQIQESRD